MKKLISFFRDGRFEELLGCLMILTVIVPVIINIVNRSVFGFYSINLEAVALLAYVWIGYAFFGYLYKKRCACGHEVSGEYDVPFCPGGL